VDCRGGDRGLHWAFENPGRAVRQWRGGSRFAGLAGWESAATLRFGRSQVENLRYGRLASLRYENLRSDAADVVTGNEFAWIAY